MSKRRESLSIQQQLPLMAVEEREKLRQHAVERLIGTIETAVRIHGGVLVATGERTWQEVRHDVHLIVDRICATWVK